MVQYNYGSMEESPAELQPSPDLIAVRVTDDASPVARGDGGVALREAFRRLDQVGDFDAVSLKVFRVTDDSDGVTELRRSVSAVPDVVAGEVLMDPVTKEPVIYTEAMFVSFEAEASDRDARRALDSLGDAWLVSRRVPYAPMGFVLTPKRPTSIGRTVFERAQAMLARPEVSRAHPELLRERGSRNVFPQQWHLGERMINGALLNESANVDAAWTISRGGGATIAVIDDGVDLRHPEFAGVGKITAPFDATRRRRDCGGPLLESDNHGTACAGVACAAGRFGASGVAPDAALMPIRNTSKLGSIDEADAIQWAADHGAHVISCSWGPPDGKWWDPTDPRHAAVVSPPAFTRLAIEHAARHGRMGRGCVISWAAGNGNEPVDNDGYAAHPDVIAVAACNDHGSKSAYSDHGDAIWCCFPSSHGQPSQTPGIFTTDRRAKRGYNRTASPEGDYTDDFGGTSSAAPGVAGVAALMIAANPLLTAAEIRQILAETAVKIDPSVGAYDASGHSKFYGYGRVDARRAVEAALTLGTV